ncbi:protein CC2D2B-like [Rhincodon typus]|uniref:protein CC2D2B-like n=1 Tax=Rhincodon typus TaxID=259920 RepID=UPI00202F8A93|nr:protein CC2D2B-like [Rhincodon typus]
MSQNRTVSQYYVTVLLEQDLQLEGNFESDEACQFFTSTLNSSTESVVQEHKMTQLKDLPSEFRLTGLEVLSVTEDLHKLTGFRPERILIKTGSTITETAVLFGYALKLDTSEFTHTHSWSEENEHLSALGLIWVEFAVNSKLPRNIEPRVLEEEGFYVSKKPHVSEKNINKMENRAIREGKYWFGEDGNIIALADPIKLSWKCRLPSPDDVEDPETSLKTVYKKAIVSELAKDIDSHFGELSQIYQLDINIANLHFLHHPLFSKEHVLAVKLMQLFDNYRQRQKQNVSQLLAEKVWKQIKNLRILNNYICTPVKLQLQEIEYTSESEMDAAVVTIWVPLPPEEENEFLFSHSRLKRLEVNYEAFGKQCEVEYIAEVIGLEQELQQQFWREMETYNEKLKNLQSKQDVKRRKLLEGDESVSEATDDEIGKPPVLSMPTDRKKMEDMARTRRMWIQRQQIKPTLIPKLLLTVDITPNSQCSGAELQRRMEVENHKFFIRIFYNDKIVSSTVSSQLLPDFSVQFRQIFNIQIIHKPESIRFEICELVSKNIKLLAKVYIPIPEVTTITSTAVLEEIEFGSDEVVTTTHEGVGSNVPFVLDETKSEEYFLLTSGKLLYAVSWGVSEDGLALAPPALKPKTYKESMDAIASIGMSWLNDLQKLAEWARKARVDPNDPQNSDLMQVIKYTTEEGQHAPEYFRLDQIQEEFNFVTDKNLELSKRFQLLMLRNSGVPEYCCFKQVPPYDKEISDNIFQEFESQRDDIFVNIGEDSLTEQRMMALKHLEKVKASVMKKLLRVRHHYTVQDMVVECEEISTISQVSLAMLSMIAPRKKMKPLRKERKKIPAQTLSDGDVKLLINVLGAYNIPMRKCIIRVLEFIDTDVSYYNASTISEVIGPDNDIVKKIQVQPFVEVTFQQSMYQTSIADGTQPCWNEKLEMDFKSPNGDYNSAALCKMKDKIVINIFDNISVPNPESDCLETCNIKPHVKHWLGSIAIPFNTVLEQSKEDNQPPLWQLETTEDEDLLHMAYIFQKDIHNLYPKRRVVVNTIDTECRVGIVTRYIRPLCPPQELLDIFPENSKATFNLIARFVSLIPYLPDHLGFSDACNTWLTSQQFLNLILGGKEDHAVLLCNYFLYMKVNAFVLLGTSILEGVTAYVITQEKTATMIWNPETGECYDQYNAFCPLQSADCLINKENVWANIQKNSLPMSINFDVTKENNWRPFFTKGSQNYVLSSVQPSELIYHVTERSLVDKLQSRIEWALKNKIMEWRAQHPTRWNRYCTGVFQNFLPLLEQNLGRSVSEEQSTGLESLLKEFKVSGFPIQMRYSNLQTIFDKVYSTGIHNIEIPNVEFAVAVYIYPYPNNVLSVWIYVASLIFIEALKIKLALLSVQPLKNFDGQSMSISREAQENVLQCCNMNRAANRVTEYMGKSAGHGQTCRSCATNLASIVPEKSSFSNLLKTFQYRYSCIEE